jgi:hypothetical protein
MADALAADVALLDAVQLAAVLFNDKAQTEQLLDETDEELE